MICWSNPKALIREGDTLYEVSYGINSSQWALSMYLLGCRVYGTIPISAWAYLLVRRMQSGFPHSTSNQYTHQLSHSIMSLASISSSWTSPAQFNTGHEAGLFEVTQVFGLQRVYRSEISTSSFVTKNMFTIVKSNLRPKIASKQRCELQRYFFCHYLKRRLRSRWDGILGRVGRMRLVLVLPDWELGGENFGVGRIFDNCWRCSSFEETPGSIQACSLSRGCPPSILSSRSREPSILIFPSYSLST